MRSIAAAMQERKKITFFHHLGYESSPRQVYDALMMDECEFLVATGTSNLDDGWHSTQKTAESRGAKKRRKNRCYSCRHEQDIEESTISETYIVLQK